MLVEINDSDLSATPKPFGKKELISKCIKVADIIFKEEKPDSELLKEIGLTGTFLLHGPTGTGKTTLAYEVIRHVEDKYGVTPYRIDISSVITSGLGDTVKNFERVFDELKKKLDTGVLIFLDEFDRFVVNRESDIELSELKRALLSIMDFFSSIQYSDRIMLIAITNYIESIDSALLRRFSFVEKVIVTPEEIKDYYQSKKNIFNKNGIELSKCEVEKCETIAELKHQYTF